MLFIHKQTKNENIFVISDLKFRLTLGLTKETEDEQFPKENNIVIMAPPIAKEKTYLRKMFRSSGGRFEGKLKFPSPEHSQMES